MKTRENDDSLGASYSTWRRVESYKLWKHKDTLSKVLTYNIRSVVELLCRFSGLGSFENRENQENGLIRRVSQTLAEPEAPARDHRHFWSILGLKIFFILLK